MKGHKAKSGGFAGNLAKLGGSHRKLSMKTDMQEPHLVHGHFKKAAKQAHKKV